MAHLANPQTCRLGRVQQGCLPSARPRLEVQISDRVRSVRNNLANSLWTLDEEQMLALTHSAPTQCPHRPDPVGTGISQHPRGVELAR